MTTKATLADRILAEIDRIENDRADILNRPRRNGKNRARIALRRCYTDRRLVERHKPEVETNVWFRFLPDGTDDYRDVEYCFTCTVGRCCGHGVSWNGQSMLDGAPELWPCETIRDLAAVYGITVDGEA